MLLRLQFGIFAGQLGDGAVMSLGQVADGDGRWEVQLKGAGLTPFSRNADDRRSCAPPSASTSPGGDTTWVCRATLAQFWRNYAIILTRLPLATGVPTTRAAASHLRLDRAA